MKRREKRCVFCGDPAACVGADGTYACTGCCSHDWALGALGGGMCGDTECTILTTKVETWKPPALRTDVAPFGFLQAWARARRGVRLAFREGSVLWGMESPL